MSIDDQLAKHLGIRKTDIDTKRLADLIISEFIFHEEMAELTMNKMATGKDQTSEFAAAFDVYNNMAYMLRDILMKSADTQEDNANT
jgi:hypothetical protein